MDTSLGRAGGASLGGEGGSEGHPVIYAPCESGRCSGEVVGDKQSWVFQETSFQLACGVFFRVYALMKKKLKNRW